MSRRRQLSEEEREERRQRDRERLQAAARELQSSEGWTRWVEVRRTNGLARYSVNNTMLIAMQASLKGIDPSFVCGYRRWSELGYQVRKGEKAIAILGPIRRWVEDEDTGKKVKRVVGFKGLPVFDLAQVDPGEDPTPVLPPPADPVSGSSHARLREPLLALAAEIGSEVSFEEIAGGAGGWFRPKDRKIAVQPSEHANREIRTLLHELAHALVALELAADEELPKLSYAEEECIVECAGHVAASSAGLDTSGEAVAYCAGWGEADRLAVVNAAAGLIDKIARRLEEAIAVDVQDGEEMKELGAAA